MRTRLVACIVATLLGACGGGGGGGGGSAGSTVNVALIAPANADAELFEGGTMRNVTLVGTASGDVASLSGKTIYVIVVDPDGLFQANPGVSFGAGNQVNVDLSGAVQAVPRHVVGNLTINVCLDVACKQPLSGSPLHLPYDVNVLAGINVDTSPFAISYRFGDARSIRSFAVTLPKYLAGWSATALETDGSPSRHAVAETSATGIDGLVTVTFIPTTVGVYTGKVRITAAADAPSGAATFEKEIAYTYTVTDNPAVLAFYEPTLVSVLIPAGTVNASFPALSLISRPGVSTVSATVEYLTWPPIADAHPNVNSWMFLFPMPSIGACFFNNGVVMPPDCLPSGLYTARVHAVVTDGAQTVDVYAPVSLVVTP
jgi:hypothetical protein